MLVTSLPDEILMLVANNLNIHSRLSLRSTCRQMRMCLDLSDVLSMDESVCLAYRAQPLAGLRLRASVKISSRFRIVADEFVPNIVAKVAIDISNTASLAYCYRYTNLTSLDVKSDTGEIVDLNGIERLTKLTHLRLSHNLVDSLAELKLTKLVHLDLSFNRIANLAGLENLPNLTYLDLSYNIIRSLAGLEKVTKLAYLDLSYNKIEYLANLVHLQSLHTLNLKENNLYDLTPITRLPSLTHLNLENCSIVDVSPLSYFTYDFLNLEGNPFDAYDSEPEEEEPEEQEPEEQEPEEEEPEE